MNLKIQVPNVRSPKFVLWIALILTIISETLIGANLIEDSEITKVIQYSIILVPLGLNVLVLVIYWPKWYKKLLFIKELKVMIGLIFILGILSLHKSWVAEKFAFNSMMELIQILLPFVFTFFMLNFLTLDEIALFMRVTLWCTIAGYFISVDFLSITAEDILRMLTVSTYSPFENSTFAEVSSGLCAYFIYNRKKMPVSAFIAIFLNLLVWKRVLVLMTVFLFIISIRGVADDIVKKSTIIVVTFAWIFFVFLIYYIYQPEIANKIRDLYGLNLESFTGYRIYRLWYVYECDFLSYGLGSSSNFISNYGRFLGAEFEMDFIRIMFEVGPIAIIAICYSYFNVIQRNKYAFVLINFCFLNLLMANGLLRYWGWTLRIITVASINYYGNNVNHYLRLNRRLYISSKKIWI